MEDKHLSTVLILVYTCFHAYKTTTIKAEQDFARAKAALGEQSLYEFLAKIGKEMRNMKLLIDRNLAQELWCEIHGPARISGKNGRKSGWMHTGLRNPSLRKVSIPLETLKQKEGGSSRAAKLLLKLLSTKRVAQSPCLIWKKQSHIPGGQRNTKRNWNSR